MELGLIVGFVALLMVAIGYGVGRRALALDRERDTLLNELQRVNDELEDRVRIRSHQLNRQRTKLALFEERDRIARDLHDRVIQRIFAAGLQVGALSRTAAKGVPVSDVAENLDLVATELDLAIRELRNSIFQLTSVDDQDGIEQVMHDVAARASRILGFMPHMMVDGEVTKISSEMVAQIASVMQEGLSNIARHAQASAAEVNVSASEGYLQVKIIDDGVGLPDPLPRSSGISNLINRARNFDGTATWSNGPEGGTVLVWRVPMDQSVVLDDAALDELSGQGNETSVMVSESDHSPAASSRS
jgi:signal transduction histidine kinase